MSGGTRVEGTDRQSGLGALTAAGTSVWLDQLRRGMIESGELKRMVDNDYLRGVTSNPAIFEKAILGSSDYDEQLAEFARNGEDAHSLYERLVIQDVQMAADVLTPVYESSNGYDGYVSLEVAPQLAHDADGTLEQARDYWKRVDRPNLMIKIPGTAEGIPAIESALYEGINVNVTLLFSVAMYRDVMDAFIRAMERRAAEGKPLDRHSVASFFVSRLDTEIDHRLESLGHKDLFGRAGLANARAAYAAFKEVFEGGRFAALREKGCPVQRPLWASTGVKNPRYPETLYSVGLVGPSSVNTMPLPTFLATAHVTDVQPDTVSIDPTSDLEALKAVGIDLDAVTDKLLHDGIEAFVVPMNKLLDGIEKRREAVVTGRPASISASLPKELEDLIAARVMKAVEDNVVHRIWSRDETVWGPAGAPEVDNRLGWLTISHKIVPEIPFLGQLSEDCFEAGLTDVVLLGMGGSSLAPEVLRQSFGDAVDGAGLRLHVLDSTEPLQIQAVEREIDPRRTLFVVSSKSGTTLETVSLFEYFYAKQTDGRHFLAITDPGTELEEKARHRRFRRTFLGDPEIGGRFSAGSMFGMVPAELMGVPLERLIEGMQIAEQACEQTEPAANAGLWLGLTLGELALQGHDKLTFIVSEPIASFGLWAEQLVAESSGKLGRGVLPVVDEPLGDPSSYGSDRVFIYLRNTDSPEEKHESFVESLIAAGQPVVTVQVGGPNDLGRIFFLAEFATAVAGWVLESNPFDQPNVEEAKQNARAVLSAEDPVEILDSSLDEVVGLIEELSEPNYLAVMGYLPYSDATDGAVARLRATVRDAAGVATTFGYGPRYLHSTGQLHKGGPATGVFIQLVHDSEEDIAIPRQTYTFRQLINAQADGDYQTLREYELPVVRVRLDAQDIPGAIDRLTKQLTDQL